MKFNEKLIAQRKEKALTQEELAEMLGVTRQAVSRWETGETTPEMPLLAKLCRVFKVSADYLINDDISDYRRTDETNVSQETPVRTSNVGNSTRKIFSIIAGGCFAFVSAMIFLIFFFMIDTGKGYGIVMLLAGALNAAASLILFISAAKKK